MEQQSGTEGAKNAPLMRDWLVLGGILALALVLRLLTLNGPLWYDEIITVLTHLSLPWSEMATGYEMNHHYLFLSLIHI